MGTVLLGTASHEVVSSHRFDSGGMFDATAGVVKDGEGFKAFVKDGWGGGIASKRHSTQEAAEQDIPRLKERFFG